MSYRPQTPNFVYPQFFPQVPLDQVQYPQISARNETVLQQIKLITSSPNERNDAMQYLSEHRENIPNLGAQLWESSAAVAALLEEIISVVPHIAAISHSHLATPTSISSNHSNRVCAALILFQSIAGNDEVRSQFLKADIPSYLFPFLHTTNQSRECEHFKLAALGIIGTIAMSNSQESLDYLVAKGFVPLCLRILKFSREIHIVFASYIIQRILSSQKGIDEICKNEDNLRSILTVLLHTVFEQAHNYNPRIARNIIFAFQYLFQSKAAAEMLMTAHFDDLDKLEKIEKSPKCDEGFLKLVSQLLHRQLN